METIIFDPNHAQNGNIDGEYIISFAGDITQIQIDKGYEFIETDMDLNGILAHGHYRIVGYPQEIALIKKTPGEIASLTQDGEKHQQIAALNSARDEERISGIEYDGNTYDSDPISLQNINGGVTRVLIAKSEGDTEWSEYWITSDNEVVLLNMADIIGLGKAASSHISALYQKYKVLKDAV